ncbi:MAG: AAA family ATPase [Ferruginibacter sp.]
MSNTQSNIFVQSIGEYIMKSTLKIKDFGPIKDVDLVLKNVNVFIGPQASGKSALAKIFTIFKSPRKFFKEIPGVGMDESHKYSKEIIVETLKLFNIDTFIKPTTEICFESEVHKISLINGEVVYNSKLLNIVKHLKLLEENYEGNRDIIIDKIHSLFDHFALFHIKASWYLKDNNLMDKQGFATLEQTKSLDQNGVKKLIGILEEIEIEVSTNAAIYIPAERIIANIIKESLANLLLNEVPLPKHILSFAAELEKQKTKSIDLGFIQENLKYKVENGSQKIYIDDTSFISLEASASGIQSVIPILSFADKMRSVDHKSFVIEEPELNLFPIAQYKLIGLIESMRWDPSIDWEDLGIIHTYTTHSPYILSALNNFLYAYKVTYNAYFEKKGSIREKEESEQEMDKRVKSIVKASINPRSFTAYQIKDGFATSIFDENIGLISDNFIDESTDIINEDFDKLMDLMK